MNTHPTPHLPTLRLVLALFAGIALAASLLVSANTAQAATRNCYGTYFNVGSQQDIACNGAAAKASWVPYTGNTIVGYVSYFCAQKSRYGFFKALDTVKAQHGATRGTALAYAGTLRGSICP